MNIRQVIAIFISLVAIVIASYYTFFNKSLEKFAPEMKASIMELLPFPTIISNADGHKDNSLYDLLINKSDSAIFIKNVDAQIDSISFLPFEMKNLSISFSYDKVNNRVNFNGSEVNRGTTKIAGAYEITAKNNVSYDFNINNSTDSLDVTAIYTPPTSTQMTDGSLSGQFIFKSENLFESLKKTNIYFFNSANNISKYPATLKGDFSFIEGKLTVSRLSIVSDDMNMDFTVEDIQASKFKVKANISSLNIDNLTRMIKYDRIRSYLVYSAISNLINFDIEARVKAEKIVYNNLDIAAADLNFISKDKEINLKNLTFILPDHTSFNTSGVITKNKFRAIYKGNVSIKNGTYEAMAGILNLPNIQGSNSKIALSTGITLSKSMLILDNLEIKENDSTLSTDLLKLLSYDNDTYLLDSNIKIDKFNEKSHFIKGLISKYNVLNNLSDPDSVKKMVSLKNKKYMIDIGLNFNNISYNKKNINNLYLKYSVSPKSISLENITSSDETFKILGAINIKLDDDKPHLDIEFNGDSVDIELFNEIVGRQFYSSYKDLSKNQNKSHKFNVFRFDLFDGKINLNLKGGKSEFISSVDCKAGIKDGIINIEDCSVGAFGGDTTFEKMSIKLDKGISYDAEYLAKNLNVDKVMKFAKYFIHTKIPIKFTGSGKVDVKGNQKSSGDSFEDIISNAVGKFNVKSVSDITINNLDLYSVISTYGNPANLKNQSNNKSQKSISTKSAPVFTTFKKGSGEFTLDNGRVKTEDFNFITNDNIRGQSSFYYSILDEKIKGLLSLVYLSNSRKIDGFNLSFSGDVGDIAVKLGAN